MQLTEVFKWKKGLLMRGNRTFSEKQNVSEQKTQKKKKAGVFSAGIAFNLIVSHLLELW